MEYPQDWVITTLGKVVRRDKAKAKDIIEEAYTFGDDVFPNTFREKEDAIAGLDRITELYPDAFLPKDEQKKKPGPKPRGKIVEQDEFRDMMRQQLIEHQEEFWQDFKKLKPEDKCPLYYKLLCYAYAKAPSEKVVDPTEVMKRKAEAKRQVVADRISQGLEGVEDTDFEE